MSLSYGGVLILPYILSVFLHCSSPLMTPSSPHQTPSLGTFISDVVALQSHARQGGVLLQGLGQRLEGQETRDLRDTMKHTAHIIPQTCENLTIAFLIYKFRFHALWQGNLLPDWKSGLTIYNFDKVVLTANIAQPNTNSWPVHPYLSCLIPLLPYTNFTSWESHPFRQFSLYSIHFTIWQVVYPII